MNILPNLILQVERQAIHDELRYRGQLAAKTIRRRNVRVRAILRMTGIIKQLDWREGGTDGGAKHLTNHNIGLGRSSLPLDLRQALLDIARLEDFDAHIDRRRRRKNGQGVADWS